MVTIHSTSITTHCNYCTFANNKKMISLTTNHRRRQGASGLTIVLAASCLLLLVDAAEQKVSEEAPTETGAAPLKQQAPEEVEATTTAGPTSATATAGNDVSVASLLHEVDGMLRELSGKVEHSYLSGISKDGVFEATCAEPLHKCGFDPVTQTPAEAQFRPEGLEYNPVFNQTVSFEANTVYLTRTADRASPEVQSLKCTTELLEKNYARFWRKHGSTKTRYVQQYFGDQSTGALVQFPARQWTPDGPDGGKRYADRCAGDGDYDIRKRNWYNNLVTGPKDIVLVLDTSSSMRKHGRGELALKAAQMVLDQLSESDLATVITFASKAETVHDEPQLRPVTREWRDELMLWLEETVFVGETNFEEGLHLAFEALKAGEGVERSHPIEKQTGIPIRSTEHCEKLVLFLTDGHSTVGKGIPELMPLLEEWNQGVGARVLTYSFGAEAAQESCRDLSCAMGGVWWHVNDGGDLADAMTSYYKLLAVSKSDAVEDRPVRFQYYPYDLAGGHDLGACAAVFDRSSTPNMLFGLSCMSANMLEDIRLIKNASDFSSSLLKAGTESLRCTTPQLSESDLQRLRLRISGDLAVCGTPWTEPANGAGGDGFMKKPGGNGGDDVTAGARARFGSNPAASAWSHYYVLLLFFGTSSWQLLTY